MADEHLISVGQICRVLGFFGHILGARNGLELEPGIHIRLLRFRGRVLIRASAGHVLGSDVLVAGAAAAAPGHFGNDGVQLGFKCGHPRGEIVAAIRVCHGVLVFHHRGRFCSGAGGRAARKMHMHVVLILRRIALVAQLFGELFHLGSVLRFESLHHQIVKLAHSFSFLFRGVADFAARPTSAAINQGCVIDD